MDNQRREQLLAQFPAMMAVRPMDPALNTCVTATERADAILTAVWGDGPHSLARIAAVLFDPRRVPALAERAGNADAEFHAREADAAEARANEWPTSWRYETPLSDTDYDPDDPSSQGAVKFWHVGSDTVTVVRGRWLDAPDRRETPADFAAGYLRYLTEALDNSPCTLAHDVCDLACAVHLAKACSGTTVLLPVARGALVLLFRCCIPCLALAGEFAANTYKTNVALAKIEAAEGWLPDRT